MIEGLASKVRSFSTDNAEQVAKFVTEVDDTLSKVRRRPLPVC